MSDDQAVSDACRRAEAVRQRAAARRDEPGRRGELPRVCCHQSAVGYRNGMVRCTDLCGELFISQAVWIEAIKAAGRLLVERAVVRSIDDKGRHES